EYLHCWQQSCAELGAPGRLPARIRDLLFVDEPAPTFYNRPAQANLQWPNRGDVRQEVVALDDLVSQDHPVRTVWKFAAKLDVGGLIGTPGGSSRPAPALLVALWLWATVEGIGSARHLARLCEQQHAYRWLCGGVAVDQVTLCSFRGESGGATDRRLARGLAALVEEGVGAPE